MARIAAASKACGSAQCTIYFSRGEAAAPRLGLPLPQVYSRLKEMNLTSVSVYMSMSESKYETEWNYE